MVQRPLTATQVDRLKAPGTFCVAPNLYIQIIPESGTRSWLFRYYRDGKTNWRGLGSCNIVGLVEAKGLAEDWRHALRHGLPIIEKRSTTTAPTFAECADQYIAAHTSDWSSAKHAHQWMVTLRDHANALSQLPVDQIGVAEVHAVLAPLWGTMRPTATRLRGRIQKVLGWATAKGFRAGDNPAMWRGGALEHLLAVSRPKPVPHEAVPYHEVPDLVARLRELKGAAPDALLFCILTASRSGEVMGARWSEIDVAAKLWVIPANRMKARLEHRVPLTDAVLKLIGKPPRVDGLVFPGSRRGKGLPAMALLDCLQGLRDDGSTVHGFRSSFRTWCAEQTDHPREIIEACLAHAVGSTVELAYMRSDHLAKRRSVMADWAEFCL